MAQHVAAVVYQHQPDASAAAAAYPGHPVQGPASSRVPAVGVMGSTAQPAVAAVVPPAAHAAAQGPAAQAARLAAQQQHPPPAAVYAPGVVGYAGYAPPPVAYAPPPSHLYAAPMDPQLQGVRASSRVAATAAAASVAAAAAADEAASSESPDEEEDKGRSKRGNKVRGHRCWPNPPLIAWEARCAHVCNTKNGCRSLVHVPCCTHIAGQEGGQG